MSNEIKALEAQIATLTAGMEACMNAIIEMQKAPTVETEAETEANVDKDFDIKFTTQLKKAKRLAANKGVTSKLVYVDGKSVWYMADSRRAPKNSTLLATISPDGAVKPAIEGLDRLIAA